MSKVKHKVNLRKTAKVGTNGKYLTKGHSPGAFAWIMGLKLSKRWLLVSIRWSVSFSHRCGATHWIIICFKDKQRISNELTTGLATLRGRHPLWIRSPVGSGISLGHFSQHRDLRSTPRAHWFNAPNSNPCQSAFSRVPFLHSPEPLHPAAVLCKPGWGRLVERQFRQGLLTSLLVPNSLSGCDFEQTCWTWCPW